jgi:tyrosyl-tRNA synthetase
MYGEVMSVPDDVIIEYFTLATDVPDSEIGEMQRAMAVGSVNPRDLKMRLAREIVGQIHGAGAARAAEVEFVRIFQQRELPVEMPTFALTAPTNIVDLLVAAKLAPSKSEARRLITQGGVEVGSSRVDDIAFLVPAQDGLVIRAGKRRFVQLRVGK